MGITIYIYIYIYIYISGYWKRAGGVGRREGHIFICTSQSVSSENKRFTVSVFHQQ